MTCLLVYLQKCMHASLWTHPTENVVASKDPTSCMYMKQNPFQLVVSSDCNQKRGFLCTHSRCHETLSNSPFDSAYRRHLLVWTSKSQHLLSFFFNHLERFAVITRHTGEPHILLTIGSQVRILTMWCFCSWLQDNLASGSRKWDYSKSQDWKAKFKLFISFVGHCQPHPLPGLKRSEHPMAPHIYNIVNLLLVCFFPHSVNLTKYKVV